MAELPFAMDRRGALAGRAMTHALLIGVSHYDHLRSLGAGAHTAMRIFQWLKDTDAACKLPAPLATVTVLLSPSEPEQAIVAEVLEADAWAPARRANILAAQRRLHDIVSETERALIKPDRDAGAGMVVYYFGGHGADFYRDDPIGLASDADDERQPWAGAFDHQEFRERFTRIDADDLPTEEDRRARCLFLYDCCRTRDHGADFQQSIELEYAPMLSEPTGVRPWQVLSATTEGFSAWEPSEPIPLPPRYEIPLSFFGHAFLNVVEWSQDFSTHPELTWQTSARGMVDNIERALIELARNDANGERLPGAPAVKRGPGNFAVLLAAEPVQVVVILSCDPESGHQTTDVLIHQRGGSGFEFRRELLAPWTNHPESCMFVPGVFRIKATIVDRTLEKTTKLAPVLTVWSWIIGHDAIAVHDPAK